MLINILFIFLAPATIGAAPQAAADGVEQIQREDDRPIEQISTGARVIISPPPSMLGERQTAARQLSSEAQSRPAPAQLTDERQSARGSEQLYTGGKTAQPAEPLSRPSEGRTASAAPVGGKDRCDPAMERDAKLERVCAAVIERRSAEFARPPTPELSPEERILVEQRARSGSAVREASRQLAESGIDADSPEAQGIASIVLREPAGPDMGDESPGLGQEISQEAAAIINAIVEGVTGSPAPPQP